MLKEYVDQLENKELKILIPGCGNAYEGEYLMKHRFKNTHLIDISQEALNGFKKRFLYIGNNIIIIIDINYTSNNLSFLFVYIRF